MGQLLLGLCVGVDVTVCNLYFSLLPLLRLEVGEGRGQARLLTRVPTTLPAAPRLQTAPPEPIPRPKVRTKVAKACHRSSKWSTTTHLATQNCIK